MDAERSYHGWSWVQFWCVFAIAGVAAFLQIDPLNDALPFHLAKSFAIGGLCAVLAGRYGDAVWHEILRILRS